MPPLAWMKKLASLLLLVCFVLPLSTCSVKQEVSTAPPGQDYWYGYQLASGSLADLSARGALTCLIAVVIVFFVPVLSLMFKGSWQALIQLCAAFPALYFLFEWMFMPYRIPQIGGILAAECWLFLLTVNPVTVWFAWRGRRKLPAAANAT